MMDKTEATIDAGVARIIEELAKVASVREGWSNDDHIAALESALSTALDLVEYNSVNGDDLEEFRRFRASAVV